MTQEGLISWIERQIGALNPDSVVGQLGLFVGIIAGALLIAVLVRQVSRVFPVARAAENGLAMLTGGPALTPGATLKSTTAAHLAYRPKSSSLDRPNRKKKKTVKSRPKKAYFNIEKAPSDPMFLPPFDTTVPYRHRIAMFGAQKNL